MPTAPTSPSSTYGQIMAVGGVTYIVAVLVLRRPS
jgi:hypothetical protein